VSKLVSLVFVAAFVVIGGLYVTVLVAVYDTCPLPHCIGAHNHSWILGACLIPLGMSPLIAAFFLMIRLG
jgi:hypothetical protein